MIDYVICNLLRCIGTGKHPLARQAEQIFAFQLFHKSLDTTGEMHGKLR
jgi:hypothetical protein